jgi:hypothetical protein
VLPGQPGGLPGRVTDADEVLFCLAIGVATRESVRDAAGGNVMATGMVIIKTKEYGGGETTLMPQVVAQKYLAKLVGTGSRLTNLSQAMNQAFNDQGKSNGALMYDGKQTMHASAGVIGVSSLTLFYYERATILYLFAMGQHKGGSSYLISDFGPTDGSFQSGKTVQLV